jgi:hypothetical protein
VKSSVFSRCTRGIGATVALLGAAASMCGAQTSRYDQFVRTYPQFANPTSWGPSSHGFHLAIISVRATYIAGEPIEIFALIRNSGQALDMGPIESYGFETTLVDASKALLNDGGENINSTGLCEITFPINATDETTLHIDERYKTLAAGTYRLTVSYTIRPGSCMDSQPEPVFVHLISNTLTIRVLPTWTPAPLLHAPRQRFCLRKVTKPIGPLL